VRAVGKRLPIQNKKRRNRLLRRFSKDCSFLECKRDAAAHHAEAIVRPIHHVPTEIAHPADMRRDAKFDTAAKLADSFGLAASVFCYDSKDQGWHNVVSLAAAEDRTATGKNIGANRDQPIG